MTDRLLIRLRPAPGGIQWLTSGADGRVLQGPVEGAPPTATVIRAARETVVLVPAADAPLIDAAVPARSRDQVDRALPFALEDQLLDPIDQLHFAWCPVPGGQRVATVRHERLRAWLAELAAIGVVPDRMIPDAGALPRHEGAASVLVEGGDALVRTANGEIAAANLDELASFLGAGQGQATLVLLEHPPGAHRWPAGLRVTRVEPAPHALAWLAPGVDADDVPNLLVGSYAPAHRGRGMRRLWLAAAALAASAVVITLALAYGERAQLRGERAQLEARMVTAYRQAFPDAQGPVPAATTLRATFDRALAMRGNGGALDRLRSVAPILTGSTQYTIKSIEYRDGVLDIGLLGDSVGTLDTVRERIGSLGFGATLSAVTSDAQGTEAKLRVEVPR